MNRSTFLQGIIVLPLMPNVPQSLPIPTTGVSATSWDLSRLLACISAVESGGKDGATETVAGRIIARGRYQLTERTWHQHTNRPWKLAHNASFAQVIAERHLFWLDNNLPRVSVDEVHFRPYALAWAWRAGLTGWNDRDKVPHYAHRAVLHDYSTRVLNLYNDPRPE